MVDLQLLNGYGKQFGLNNQCFNWIYYSLTTWQIFFSNQNCDGYTMAIKGGYL